MKHLYSRLALTTSLFLVLGYWLVHAAVMWVPMKIVQPEDPMTANIWNSLLGNVEFLSGGISQVTSSVNTLSGKLGLLSAGQWCSSDGSKINCNNAIPATTGNILWNTGTSNSINYTAGNVGIGTTSPGAKLDIRRNTSDTITADEENSTAFFRVRGNNETNKLEIGIGSTGLNWAAWIQSAYDNGGPNYGTEPLLLNPIGGNVGIGTTSPGAKLDINGSLYISPNTAGKNTFQFSTQAVDDAKLIMNSDTTTKVVISAGGSTYFNGGNVGIGTTSPSTKLHITSNTVGTVYDALTLQNTDNSVSGQGTRLIFKNSTYHSVEAAKYAYISYIATGNYSEQGALTFGTNNGYGVSPIERVRIDAAGNVGIGTTSPDVSLRIARDITSQNNTNSDPLAWNQNSQMKISSGNNALAFSVIGDFNQRLGIIQAGHDGDGYGGYANLSDPKLALQPYGGNVGIGTSSPEAMLHIPNNTYNIAWLGSLSLGRSGGHYSEIGYNINFQDTNGTYKYRFADTAAAIRLGSLPDGQGGGIELRTAPAGGAGTALPLSTKMFISNSGNVGIGTTSPGANLDITAANPITYLTSSANSNARLKLYQGFNTYITATNAMYFGVSGTDANAVTVLANGNVGIGTTSPYMHSRLHVKAPSSTPWGVMVEANSNDGTIGISHDGNVGVIGVSYHNSLGYTPLTFQTSNTERIRILANGNVGIGTTDPLGYKLYVNGNFYANGTLGASGLKSFIIQDPRYNDPNRRLTHAAIEGPEGAVYYRGEARLNNGETDVELPGYFEALTRKEGRTILLTNIDGFDRVAVKSQNDVQVKDGKFVVYSDNKSSMQRFSWEVKAVRGDVDPLAAETTVKDGVEHNKDGGTVNLGSKFSAQPTSRAPTPAPKIEAPLQKGLQSSGTVSVPTALRINKPKALVSSSSGNTSSKTLTGESSPEVMVSNASKGDITEKTPESPTSSVPRASSNRWFGFIGILALLLGTLGFFFIRKR